MDTKNFKELKTTLAGFAVWIMDGFYFMAPYFSDKHLWHVNEYAVGIGVVAGLLLILAPDRFVDFLFKWMDKKK